MTLYEIYYHDEWRSIDTYSREHIASSAEDAKQWLMENLDDWYDDNDPTIDDDIITQAMDQEFMYMTVQTITINNDGTVDWD